MHGVRVICCRDSAAAAQADESTAEPFAAIHRHADPPPVHLVGSRPGKQIDDLLTGQVLVIGDDADLAAVVKRLQRRELLESVVVGYATGRPTPMTDLYSLPTGAAAVRLALLGEPDLVPVVRDDVGGLLVARGVLGPVDGTVYVDEARVLHGRARLVVVAPSPEKGVEVTVVRYRVLGFGRRPRVHLGRAVSVGSAAARVSSDGVVHPRAVTRWTYYLHTSRLRLIRGVV